MGLPRGFRNPVTPSEQERKAFGLYTCNAVTNTHEYGLCVITRADYGTEPFVSLPVEERRSASFFRSGFVVFPEIPLSSHAECRAVELHSQIAGEPEAAGMGQPMAVRYDDVG